MIESIEVKSKANNVDSDHEGMDSNDDVGPIIHTVYALAGYSNLQTMKV